MYLFTYSIVLAIKDVESCDTSLNISPSAQLTLWIFTKTFSCLLWVYAIIYVLWPRHLHLFKERPESIESETDSDDYESE